MKQEIRSCARLLLFDNEQKLLLFLHVDPTGREFWATPGGGIEPGENREQAARREAAEELGATQVELIEMWTGKSEFLFADRHVSQTETFFLVTSHSGFLNEQVRETHQREGIKQFKWWTVEEIKQTNESLFPLDLAERLEDFFPRDSEASASVNNDQPVKEIP